MQILHLVTRSQPRGAELVALELAGALDELGHENQVVALSPDVDGTELNELRTLTRRRSLRSIDLPFHIAGLTRKLSGAHFDLLLVHGGYAAWTSAFTPSSRRLPVVWQRILPFPPELFRGVRLRVWRHVARSVQGVVGLTETDIEEVRRLGFEGPAESIPNFRRPQRFAQVDRPRARARLGRELGLHDGVRIVGFVSRLVDQKRPDRALQVMRELRSRHVAAHLVIAGDGPLRADVEALARESGLEASTSFLGHRDDIEEVLGGLDVLLVTSASEGIPGTVIEAQMTGCPVIATDVGAIGSVVRSGVTGFVLDYDPQSLAQALTSVLEDPVRAAEMSRAARARGLEFSIDKVVSRYERFLTEIAGSRSR